MLLWMEALIIELFTIFAALTSNVTVNLEAGLV